MVDVSFVAVCIISVSVVATSEAQQGNPTQFFPSESKDKFWWMKDNPWKRHVESAPLIQSFEYEDCTCTAPDICIDLRMDVRNINEKDKDKCPPDEVCCFQKEPEVHQPYSRPQEENEVVSYPQKTSATVQRSPAVQPKPGNVAIKLDEGGPDEPDDSISFCGIDAREHILDPKVGEEEPSDETQFAEFPWILVVLQEENGIVEKLCGATLLSQDIAVTAAHCINENKLHTLTVRAGEWDLESEYGMDEAIHHQSRKIKKIIYHNDYNRANLLNDIALIILDSPFDMANNIRTICLPSLDDELISCLAVGWGSTGSVIDPTTQRYMRQSRLEWVPREQCTKELQKSGKGPRYRVRSTQICARNKQEGSTCVGGCGGALFCQSKAPPFRFVIVGVASQGACKDKALGVFTNVYKYKDWIMNTMDDWAAENLKE